MDGRKVSIKNLRDDLSRAIREDIVTEDATIMWADVVEEDDEVCVNRGLSPGTIRFFTERIVDGTIERGTLYIQPERISRMLS